METWKQQENFAARPLCCISPYARPGQSYCWRLGPLPGLPELCGLGGWGKASAERVINDDGGKEGITAVWGGR